MKRVKQRYEDSENVWCYYDGEHRNTKNRNLIGELYVRSRKIQERIL